MENMKKNRTRKIRPIVRQEINQLKLTQMIKLADKDRKPFLNCIPDFKMSQTDTIKKDKGRETIQMKQRKHN